MWDPSMLNAEQRAALVKKVMGPRRIELHGVARDHVLLLLKFYEPVLRSNSQRTSTDHYSVNGIQYNLHYGYYDDNELDPMVEEIEIENPDKY